MKHLEFHGSFARLLAGVLVCTLFAALLMPRLLGLESAAGENGPLEWTQELALLVAIVFSGAAAVGLRGAERMAAYLAALLYCVFLLRELELPPVGPVTRYLASHAFRWHEAIALTLLILPYAVLRRRYWRNLLAYGLSLRGWPFALAALLVGIGAVFDGAPGLGGVAYLGTFLEETAELLGYTVLAAAAGWVLAGLHAEGAAHSPGLDPANAFGCGSRGR